MLNKVYTKPRLCKSKDGQWYVHFSYLGKPKKFKKGINYIKNRKEKETFGNALAKHLHQKLKDGWNPLVSEELTNNDIYFIDALKFGLKEKNNSVKPKTFNNYKNTLDLIIDVINKLGLDYLKIENVKRLHIRSIIKKCKESYDLSNHGRNKYLSHLSAVMNELLDSDIIDNNPCHKIKNLPVAESNANRTSSKDEHTLIKEELSKNHVNFYKFIQTEYHTGIRPNEILSIQLHMVNLEDREINLPPIITKSGVKRRDVVINNPMLDILEDMNLKDLPKQYYLFGSFRIKGQGNRGKFEDFIPGPTRIKRDTATKRWKRIIKDGLGIDVNMYSYKHKGGDDKIIAGVELDSIRNQYGHSTKRMTEHYVKQIKGIYKRDIVENSPEF